MEFNFMTQVKATKEKIWEYYADIEKWYVWEEDLKNITLHGERKRQLEAMGITHPQFVMLTVLGYSLQFEAEVTQIMKFQNGFLNKAISARVTQLGAFTYKAFLYNT